MEPTFLKLDANEGRGIPPARLDGILRRAADIGVSRYASAARLEAQLAERCKVSPRQVLVTPGADGALERIALVTLGHGREAVVPVPTFDMILKYVGFSGASVRSILWSKAPWPVEEILESLSSRTGLVVCVSPNNPTGEVARREDVVRVCGAAPQVPFLLDAAYGEFCEDDLTALALTFPQAIVARTLSKAWGLAGLRVGYVLGHPDFISRLRDAEHPWPVSSLSIAVASLWLEEGQDVTESYVREARSERERLLDFLRKKGGETWNSQANSVLVRFPGGERLQRGLAERGIGVRLMRGHPLVEGCLRITCPGDEGDFQRLVGALEGVLGENGT